MVISCVPRLHSMVISCVSAMHFEDIINLIHFLLKNLVLKFLLYIMLVYNDVILKELKGLNESQHVKPKTEISKQLKMDT